MGQEANMFERQRSYGRDRDIYNTYFLIFFCSSTTCLAILNHNFFLNGSSSSGLSAFNLANSKSTYIILIIITITKIITIRTGNERKRMNTPVYIYQYREQQQEQYDLLLGLILRLPRIVASSRILPRKRLLYSLRYITGGRISHRNTFQIAIRYQELWGEYIIIIIYQQLISEMRYIERQMDRQINRQSSIYAEEF